MWGFLSVVSDISDISSIKYLYLILTYMTMQKFLTFLLLVCFSVALSSSKPNKDKIRMTNISQDLVNKLTPKEIASGWKLLWDGETFQGWHNFNKEGLTGWKIEGGNLISLGQGGDHSNDIVTNQEFQNFELSLEWKISPGGNSGIFFNAVEGKHDEIYAIAPEYQLIDELGWQGKLEDWQKTGCCYAMYLAKTDKKLKPVGEFNVSKIIIKDGQVEHWLNGEKIVEYQLWSDDWNKRAKEGKWKDYPDYASAKSGKIGLQDHGKSTYFRNIKIRLL
jgi:hypothetical protein